MAFRAAVRNQIQAYWKSMANELQRSANFTTSNSPKLKAYGPTADQFQSSRGGLKSKIPKGDFVPVCVAVGMIGISVGFGTYTALHQLGRAPNVFVKKSRRKSIAEVAEPEHVSEEAEKFVKQSFFRKVAHIQGVDGMEDPIRGDIYKRAMRVETLEANA